MSPRAHAAAAALLALAAIGAVAAHDDGILYELTDEQYYQMPQLFELDEYEGCLATGGAYCLGSFELTPERPRHELFDVMTRWSANWVDHFNHTRLHRGLCLPRRCTRQHAHAHAHARATRADALAEWFSWCVNDTTSSAYNLSARLYHLDYCTEGAGAASDRALSGSERGFALFVAALVALAAVSTVLDITLSDDAKKGAQWALCWSVPACWRALHAAPAARSARTDLRALDGLRVLAMLCVIVEHVCWISTHTYLADTRKYEQMRRDVEVVMMANSTLVVQIFFMMSSFLLAHKLLEQRAAGQPVPAISTFFDTMLNRIIRISPSYFAVVWFAASWWERLGRGPMWAPLVASEAAICRRKWWTHLLYVNNVVQADDKCLIQTWYLAADMQLYAVSLALTLALGRWRRAAVAALAALLAAAVALLGARAYADSLVPTYVMHRPESVRATYRGEASFDALYQAPLGNAAGALAGLLLAHLHHALLRRGVALRGRRVFGWVSTAATPVAAWWVAASPQLLGRGPPARGAAAALAALERPVFSLFVGLALLGAMHGVPSSVGRCLSWRGWAAWARLSFGALLLHMPINKALVAGRLAPSQLDRPAAIIEWWGVAAASYLCALPLALLLELPPQRLVRALRPARARPPQADPPASHAAKADL